MTKGDHHTEDLGLSAAQVHHIARLARLELTDQQAERYRHDLIKVLAWAALLDQEDLTHLEPMAAVCDDDGTLPAPCWALDEPGPMLGPDVLGSIAPAMDGPFIAVPKVLDGGGGG